MDLNTQQTQHPTLPECPDARVLTASQFAAIHMAHILAHPPDGVLFPFLHGLEGDNTAQNTFFAATSPRGPPKFRGLVWVVAEDDLEFEGSMPSRGVEMGEEDGYSDDEGDDDDDDEEDDDDELVDMDIDSTVHIVRSDDLPSIQTLDDAKHMHPIHHRASEVADVPMEIALPPPTSLLPATPSSFSSIPSQYSEHPPAVSTEDWDPLNPPLLTCTFRPRELIRPVERAPPATPLPAPAGEPNDDDWEFRPARIPDGISLRNFGIQVPIYATLSDIVIYSPKGLSSSRTLVPLAKRFVAAIARKRTERCRKLGVDPNDVDNAPLAYNVYVLDADARALKAEVPELMMRVFDSGEAGRRSRAWLNADGNGMQVDSDAPHAHTHAHDAPVAVPLQPHTRADTAPNTVDFGQRERDEMRELTRASEILTIRRRPSTPSADSDDEEDLSTTTTATHWRPMLGQVFLGNSGDVPLAVVPPPPSSDSSHSFNGADLEQEKEKEDPNDPFNYTLTNSPAAGMGYDICVECHEMAPFPSIAHLRAAEEHVGMLEGMWARTEAGEKKNIRPPPNANTVIHLPFPSAPPNTPQTMNALLPVLAFLERCLRPVEEETTTPSSNSQQTNGVGANTNGSLGGSGHGRRWSTSPGPLSSFFPAPPSPVPSPPPGAAPRTRSFTSPISSPSPQPATTNSAISFLLAPRTRPLKILVYSSDGYTESSPLALSLLMAVRHLSLPEAYLELQVAKRRSFFVYPGELGLLRRVEGRLTIKGQGGEVFGPTAGAGRAAASGMARRASATGEVAAPTPKPYTGARPPAKSVSFAAAPAPSNGAVSSSVPTSPPMVVPNSQTRSGRPRARTSPWLPSFGDHQSWFNDPRFDGSFPSRVLPFLYLGNLNHATNAYMLHALGITHVVSVGECALLPPPGHCNAAPGEACTHNHHHMSSKGANSHGQGSLWIEEREGRIKVLDIKGVCDDGIDTLEPQLEPICDWIERARLEGGQVLVHCRVGVSRSATVTIAYVMKHLALPLVDAYLIVRSRRLSVLIQPNMRLLYNLCGWEIKLAKERAERAVAGNGDGESEEEKRMRLRKELARTLTWPFLAKEVHALNDKYLH
ncbi:hypothetical protein C8F01DRAFT_1121343 [Mycena amicta]|nr:hypothetical protein C8F01DRAFT_1121343 [Mycena amicta]